MLTANAFDRDRKRALRDQRREDRAERKPVPVTVNGVAVVPRAPDPEPVELPLHQRDLPDVEPLPSIEQLRGAARYRWRRTLVHLRRCPRYGRRVSRWWGRGVARTADAWWHWCTQPEHRQLARRAAAADDHKKHAGHLSDARWGAVQALFGLGSAAFLAGGLWQWAGLRGVAAAWLVAGVLLVVIGKRPEEHLVTVADEADDKAGPVTVDRVALALGGALGSEVTTIGGVTHAGRRPYTHSQVTVDLGGKVIEDAARALPRFAARFGVSRSQVFVEPVPGGVEGRVVVTVTDRDPMAGDPPEHPLSRAAGHDLWNEGAPLGVDPRGKQRSVPVLWEHLVVGGQQRVGKSLAIGAVLAAPVLDLAWDYDLLEFKGDQFYGPLRPGAGTYITVAEDRAAERTLTFFEELEDTVLSRNSLIGRLPVSECPLGKLTEDMARRDSRFRPRFVVCDEFQNVLDDERGGDILKVVTRLARTAASQGVSFAFGFQRAPRRSIEDLRSFLTVRVALSMQEVADSAMVLGGEQVNGVVDATTIPRERPGVGFVVGGGPTGLVRVFDWDRGAMEQLAARALPLRREAGVLPEAERARPLSLVKSDPELLVRVASLFDGTEEWLPSAEIARRLGHRWNARRVGKELRRLEVPVEELSWRDADGTHTVVGVWRRDLP